MNDAELDALIWRLQGLSDYVENDVSNAMGSAVDALTALRVERDTLRQSFGENGVALRALLRETEDYFDSAAGLRHRICIAMQAESDSRVTAPSVAAAPSR